MHLYRSHTCGALRLSDAGQEVRLSGWIHRKRDHGGLLFIDLRDHYGVTQLVLSPSNPSFQLAEKLRAESVIRVDGEVVARTADTVNPNLPTGEIEVRVKSVEVLGAAERGTVQLPMRMQFHASGYNVSHAGPKVDGTGHFRLTLERSGQKSEVIELDGGQTEVWLSPPRGSYSARLDLVGNADGRPMAQARPVSFTVP